MTIVNYSARNYPIKQGESMLDALIRQGADISFSCRNGVCHTCMIRSHDEGIPEKSRAGIKPALAEKGYFLPCRCYPESDVNCHPLDNLDLTTTGILMGRKQLAPDVWQIQIQPYTDFYYQAGQFINVYNGELARSYSLSSVYAEDPYLEIQVKHYLDGQISPWLCEQLEVGDEIVFSSSIGECCYQKKDTSRTLLLISSGTGLSGCIGILREALLQNHTLPIRLLHGAQTKRNLYLHDFLLKLQHQHPNFSYVPCLSKEAVDGIFHGRVTDIAIQQDIDINSTTLFVAGPDKMVEKCVKIARAEGVQPAHLRTDSHSQAACTASKSELTPPVSEATDLTDEVGYPLPEPDLWEALGEGVVLRSIMDDFYDLVFEDEIMAPYFHNSTKQRAKEKVYSFYRRLFSGDKVYFGDRPRNAHHWMVIPDCVYDYRERLLRGVMDKHGLSEDMIAKWQSVEALYRPDIVKDKPWGRRVGNIEAPVQGFAREALGIGSVCDSCEDFVEEGIEVIYHLRTGHIYCPDCSGSVEQEVIS